ncbi:MAG TPA: ABC transporter substrate-binding protein [Anaerolineales bacterium]|nr:ABC transporter substrate-binding protein [Anaerolineales bacterium]
MHTPHAWPRATIACLLLAAGLLAACQPAPATVAPTDVGATIVPTVVAPTLAPTDVVATTPPEEIGPSGQLRIAQVADINTLDPKFLKGRETQNVLRLMFDSLFHRDDKMQIIPWLATSVENPDELTWRFHLREGVKFNNGNDFRANDVKFTVERLREDDSVWSDRSFLDRIEVIDDYTVDIITKAPYAAFLTRVVLWHMTDEEYFNEVGAEGFLSSPVGTGPYKFVSWVKDEQVVLEANTDYWRGAPKIETVIFTPIPESATRLAALEAGDVDIVTDVPPAYTDQPGAGVEIATIPGTRAFYLGMNVNVKPFDDVRVRQAMNYAVDVEAIIEFVLNGLARPIDNPLLPEAVGYTETPVYHYDPDKAVSLLTEAGYPDGFEMELDVAPALKEIAEAVAGQLSAVGIVANINVLETAALTAKYEPGGSQAFLTSWGNSEADADGILSKQFYSKRYGCDLVAFPYPAPESGYGDADKGCYYTGYGNSKVDAAIVEGARNVDPTVRKAAYARALQIIVEEAPWVFLYNPSEIYGYRGVEGWTPRSDALINLENASVTK